MSRSFTGCKRCKARRQKCDEQRPACNRCTTASVPCRYAMQLQWGGRAFSRSRFGACMDNGSMQRLEYSPGEFIYTTEPSSPATTTGGSPTQSQTLSRPIDPFSNLSTDQKSLLHHFLRDASQITACHPGMRHEICQMLVPRALQTPSLLYATLALSAIHLQALRSHHQSENVKSAPHIARLVAWSLEHFRSELQTTSRDKGSSDVLLATARTLCLAEIHSGAIHPNSWRAHIEGARALMVATEPSSGEGEGEGEGKFRQYLDRWHRSIVSLTALTGNGPPIGEVDGTGGLGSDTPDYLDDYWGFTVRLAAVFRGIGWVAWRARQRGSSTMHKVGGGDVDHEISQCASHDTEQHPETATDTATATLHDETNTLESTLHHLISQTTTHPPTHPLQHRLPTQRSHPNPPPPPPHPLLLSHRAILCPAHPILHSRDRPRPRPQPMGAPHDAALHCGV